MARIDRIAEPSAADRKAISEPLSAFSDQALNGLDTSYTPLALLIRDDDNGAAEGGLWGHIYYEWLFVELLFVPPSRRGQGLGRTLLHLAEDEARQHSCRGVWLDTFSFQARGFYEKEGYTVFGRIDDYPAHHHRLFLSKRL